MDKLDICNNNCDSIANNRSRQRSWTCSSANIQDETETVQCSQTNRECNIPAWSNWSVCSVTCGEGQRKRDRSCVSKSNCEYALSQNGPVSRRRAVHQLGQIGLAVALRRTYFCNYDRKITVLERKRQNISHVI